ncbi:class I SAM-dependent methyltransferase [Streptomyces sp. RK75]|nr:class I SAM-dependent methyltransferase [Streptomyces sp. RK75]
MWPYGYTVAYETSLEFRSRDVTGEAHDSRRWLDQQLAYYRARATEYDEGYQRRMPIPTLRKAIADLPIAGDVLELACGTGQWTPLLAERARTLTASDAAPEMLELARQRVLEPSVRFEQIDVFNWQPRAQYDTVFFAFWLSHVPSDRMSEFWHLLRDALRPGGHVVFLDDGPAKVQLEEPLASDGSPLVLRRLRDGAKHCAVKVLYGADELAGVLAELSWEARVRMVDGHHLAGCATWRGDCQ